MGDKRSGYSILFEGLMERAPYSEEPQVLDSVVGHIRRRFVYTTTKHLSEGFTDGLWASSKVAVRCQWEIIIATETKLEKDNEELRRGEEVVTAFDGRVRHM